jgi:hypothetical protein
MNCFGATTCVKLKEIMKIISAAPSITNHGRAKIRVIHNQNSGWLNKLSMDEYGSCR